MDAPILQRRNFGFNMDSLRLIQVASRGGFSKACSSLLCQYYLWLPPHQCVHGGMGGEKQQRHDSE